MRGEKIANCEVLTVLYILIILTWPYAMLPALCSIFSLHLAERIPMAMSNSTAAASKTHIEKQIGKLFDS